MSANYPAHWLIKPLSEVMEAIIDYRGKTPVKTSSGVPLITAKIVKNGRIETPEEFIAESQYENWMVRGLPRAGDVVVTTEAPLGEVAQLESSNVALAQRIVTLRGKKGELDNDYLLYLMQSKYVQEQLESRASGSTVRGIKQSELRKILLPIPPEREQVEIARNLKTLDKKISVNRQTNYILEQMAQAIFKSWFVDFDPVRAKMAGRLPEGMDATTAALFPDSLEESELGLVPKGWRISTLGEICDSNDGLIQTGPFGSQLHASDYVAEGVPVVMPRDISNRRVDVTTASRVRLEDANRLAKHQLRDGDIVFSRRGDVEKHALIGETEHGWLCGTGCLLVRPGMQRNVASYLSRSLDLPQTKQWLTQHAVGATMPNLNTGILSAVPVVLPADGVLAAFDLMTNTIDRRISAGNAAAQTLTQLRDTLLSKLFSGELSLAAAEKLAEQAMA